MLTWTASFFLCFSIVQMSPVSQGDRIIFPGTIEEFNVRNGIKEAVKPTQIEPEVPALGLEIPEPTKEFLNKCLDLGDYMPGFNETSLEFECYALTTQGPCLDNEWFVLNSASLKAECQIRPCQSKSEVMFKGDCKKIGSVANCPQGMEMLPSFTGEGMCQCREGYLPWNNNTICYQEFLRGPCPDGQQLILVNNVPKCNETDCPSEYIRWSNGACVPTIDCSDTENSRVIFSSDDNGLQCASEELGVRSILIVPTDCGDGYTLDSNSECVRIEDVSSLRNPRLAKRRNLRQLLRFRL